MRKPLLLALVSSILFVSGSDDAVGQHGQHEHDSSLTGVDGKREEGKGERPSDEPPAAPARTLGAKMLTGAGVIDITEGAVPLAGGGRVSAGTPDRVAVDAGRAGERGARPRGDMTRADALALFAARTAAIDRLYAREMDGKFSIIGNGVIDDLRDSVQNLPPDRAFSSKRFNAQMAMLDAQLAVDFAKEAPGLNPQTRAKMLQAAQAQYDKAHNLVQALPRPVGEPERQRPGGDWHGFDPMERFHSKYTREYSAYRPAVDPAKPGSVPNPGGGHPPESHIGDMIKQDPENPNNWKTSAQRKLSQGDRGGAMADLNRSIELGGGAEPLAMRAAMKLEDKDFDGARQDAKKALELDPGDPNAIAVLKFSEGRASAGSDSSPAAGGGAGYDGGFASGGSGAGARALSGMTDASIAASAQKLDDARSAMRMNDFQAAVSLAQRALELNPSNAAAYGFLSSIFAQRKDYRRALASADAGLALAPRSPPLLNNKAFAENRLKLYKDALASANGAFEAGARDPLSYANRAHAYGGLGDKDAMMADINRAASMDPRYREAAAAAAALQLPTDEDMIFLFPGEAGAESGSDTASERRKSFSFVVGAGVLGGLLLALGLLSTVLAPLKDSVVSAFTRATRVGPSVHALEQEATPAPVAGLIRGQYQIARKIGEGGMGLVYEGTDKSLGRRVAIKKMRDELRLNPRERARFIIEAKTVASLRHANIVDIYAIAEEGEDVFLVFEYVEGRTIHDLVQANGRLSPAEALRVTTAMSEALTYAHSRGVIHRDMKPSNVMLSSAGEIKVMDFGIARMAKDALTRYSMTNNVVGTPPYMAPEQEQGLVRKESDVYSLAVCAYEMLTGKLPFIGIAAGMLMNKINMSYIPPSRAIAGLPARLDEVFRKAFQADPDQRYRTPQEFVAALAASVDGARSKAA